MELQANLPTIAAAGALFAISYDPISVLADFACRYGIGFPLLSDEGSRFINQLGIRNTTVGPTERAWGVPYPGTYFVGADGRVSDKVFHQTHRVRDAALTAVREHLRLPTPAGGLQDRRETDALVAIATLDSATFVRGERLGLTLMIRPAAGIHLYGWPLPAGYLPTTLRVQAPEGVVVEPVRYPQPRPFRSEWLDEELMVYEGDVTLTTALTFADRQEDATIIAGLDYQACTMQDCLLPQTLSFSLPARFRAFPP